MMVLDNHEISLLHQMNLVSVSHMMNPSHHNEEEGGQLGLFVPQCWVFMLQSLIHGSSVYFPLRYMPHLGMDLRLSSVLKQSNFSQIAAV